MLYELEQVQRVHGERTVIDIDHLAIARGKVYTLIGPNGAGKTSLLKILAFLDHPTRGRILFQDTEVRYQQNQVLALRRRVSLLDQDPIMFTGTVYANVEFGLKVRKLAKNIRHQRIMETLDLVGMADFADYPAGALSGGETKRVALARALALQPEVLLCDEPTANVDVENQEIILNIIKRSSSEQGMSVIFSTHYLAQGQRLADHTLLLQHGSLSDIVNDNVFRIRVGEVQGTRFLCQLSGALYVMLPTDKLPAGTEVGRLHINPQEIVLVAEDAPPENGGNMVAGHLVELLEQQGRARMVVDVGVMLAISIPFQQYLKIRPALGQKLRLFIPDHAVSFTRLGY